MNQIINTSDELASYDALCDLALADLSSEGSRIQYSSTYQSWRVWAQTYGLGPLSAINTMNIKTYLEDLRNEGRAANTLRSHLAHLRKLLSIGSLYDESGLFSKLNDQIKHLKMPRDKTGDSGPRPALTSSQVHKVMKALDLLDDNMRNRRNAALVILSFATGARISELISLRWADINLEEKTLTIRFGKGGKRRVCGIVDGWAAEEELLRWSDLCNPDERVFVFCNVLHNQTLGKDKPISRMAASQIINEISDLSGVKFTNHAIRRTMATAALGQGTPMADVQAQGGWSSPRTILEHYANSADAQNLHKTIRPRIKRNI